MLNSPRKLSVQNLVAPAGSLLFFILFYLYLWLKVQPHLIYHGGGVITNFPVFFRGWDFCREFMLYPSGPLEYLSAFLSQFFYYSWAGAFILTLQGWLLFICTGCFFKVINARWLYWTRFIPPVLLLITYNQYTYHFPTTMGLLVSLLFVCLYLKITLDRTSLSLVVFLALSVLVHAISGGAYLVFATLCTIYELVLRRRWLTGVVFSLSAVVIPYVEGVLIFNVTPIDAFTKLMPTPWEIIYYVASRRMIKIVYLLYIFLPVMALGLGFWRILFGTAVLVPNRHNKPGAIPDLIGAEQKTQDKPITGVLSWYKNSAIIRWSIESMVLFVVAGTAVFFSHNSKLKTFFEIEYYAYHKMWPQLLTASNSYKEHNRTIVNTTFQALYYTGRLGCDMFLYPQRPGTLFLLAKQYLRADFQRIEVFINLGLINWADHAVGESLEKYGERPIILKRAALFNMVKGRIGAAKIYLTALSKTLFYSEWASDYLEQLERDPNLSKDEQVQRLRSFMIEKDYTGLLYKNKNMLLDLLEKNSQNRMAFEYLMSWCLLHGDFEEIAKNLYRLDELGYSEIPRLYEEAVLVYMANTKKEVNLGNLRISAASRLRFKGYLNIYDRHGGNKRAAVNELKEKYGDSYLFYSMYAFSGADR
ncbi:MAG: DUF6057 family protein [Planctomycetota bacterium]|jgi:hypothetical protein